jgi:hypothetical protein
MMKRGILITVTMAAIMAVGVVSASAVPISTTIVDNYIGGRATNINWANMDVIGDAAFFDISKMVVTFNSSGAIYVDVYSRYLDNIGKYGTDLGDLFISTDGWSSDNDSESWEYALVLAGNGGLGLYKITSQDSISLSDDYMLLTGNIYRSGQEVTLNTTDLSGDKIGNGTWYIEKSGTTVDTDDYLRFAFTMDLAGISELGFHWTMTCGNDVIEGKAPVPNPEPSTVLLLGSSVVGFAVLRFRKRKTV